MPRTTSDLIVFVPGFLGFDQIGGFPYFARPCQEIVERELVDNGRTDVRVDVVDTIPAGSLLARQESLITELLRLEVEHRPKRIHLVGHSAGGVDCELLTRTRPLVPQAEWDAFQPVRAKLATLTACAAPMQGTWISASGLAEFVGALGREGILETLGHAGAGDLVWLVLSAVLATAKNPVVRALSLSLLTDPGKSLPFVCSLWKHRELVAELHPRAMQDLHAHVGLRSLDVRRTNFVTVAPPPRDGRVTLYANLYRALSDSTPGGGVPARCVRALAEAVARSPITSGWLPERASAFSSDGVVNSALQFQGGERLVVVAGDHLDVLGHFSPRGEPAEVSGLLESGALFRAAQATVLYRRIAQAILDAVPSRTRPSSTVRRHSSLPPPS